jgi:O-antigen/teichoic acid export membrane protein
LYFYASENGKVLRQSATTWGIVLLGLVAGQGASALALIVIARGVSSVEYGQYLACYGLVNLLVVLPNFGMEVWLLTRGCSTESQAAQLWRSSLRVRAQLLVLWIVAMVGLSQLLPRETYPVRVLLPAMLGVALDGLTLLSYAALRVVNRHKRVAVLQCVSSSALLGVALMLPLGPDRIAIFAGGRAILSAIFLAATILAGSRYLKLPAPPVPARDILGSARPFMLADIATAIYSGVGLTIVSLFLGAAQAGVYGPALSTLQFVFLVPMALFLLVAPILSRQYAAGETMFVRIGLAQLAAQALAGLGLSTVIVLFAPFIVRFTFGPAYESSAAVLRLLGLVPLFKSLNFALASILTSTNLQPERTKVQALCAAFTVAADLALVPMLGIIGVVIVHSLNEMILCAGYSFVVHRRLGRLVASIAQPRFGASRL